MIRPSWPFLRLAALALLAAPTVAACSGIVGDPGEKTPGSTTNTPGTGGTVPTVANCSGPPAASDFHRLNAKQYQESISQVLGMPVPLLADMPPDANLYGFDNNADTSLTAALTQRYLDGAKKAVTMALANATARAKLVTCDLQKGGATCVRALLTDWLPKVFRRPVLPAEIDSYLTYTSTCASSAEAGLSCAMQAALLSPKFLFRGEVLPSAESAMCSDETPLMSTSKNILGQYALASRLSYLLWNSPPDDALYAAAAAGALNKPDELAAQVDRMLAPPMLAAHGFSFVQDFPSQWLPVGPLATAQPSKTRFPTFDEPLRQAMADESRLFFADVLSKNGTALDLLKADFTYLNERLARHYGIAGVTGPDMRRVSTAGSLRGGIPTQGTFLTATSSTENTAIVQRAKWVLNNLLCVDLPAPPDKAVIDSVPVPDPGLGLTGREALAQRTSGEPCHSCHVNINPIGFGLETFDAIGAIRQTDNGKPIDSSGMLPGGATFANTDEMLNLLRKDDRFGTCVTTKMLTYALGRGMVARCDDKLIAELATQFKNDGYKLKNHLVRIVQSAAFNSSRARAEVSP